MHKILVDMLDAIRFALFNNTPSGIQRVAFSVTAINDLVQLVAIEWQTGFVWIPLGANILTWNSIKAFGDSEGCEDFNIFLNKYVVHFRKVTIRDYYDVNFLFLVGPWNFQNVAFSINKLAVKNNVMIYVHDLIPFESIKAMEYANDFTNFFITLKSKKINFYTSTNRNARVIKDELKVNNVKLVPFASETNLFNAIYSKNDDLKKIEQDFFYISVGAVDGRKRHDKIIKRWIDEEIYKEYKLFIIGSILVEDKAFDLQCKRVNEVTESIIFLGHIDDILYSRMCAASKGIFYPSYNEGFGLVPIDAEVCDKPCFIPIEANYKDAHNCYVEIDLDSFSKQDIIQPNQTINKSRYYKS